MDCSLSSIRTVMLAFGNPQDTIPCVHIAGTNGKGSTAAAVSAILGRAGNHVGLTTSPHLLSVNERIVVDGLPVSDEELNRALEQVISVQAAESVSLSYFELIIAAALLIFKEHDVDYMVLETGLGGRLDATNIVKRPVATAITSISLEHQDVLGDTIELIAAEKAGIIKEGVPVVVGPVATSVLDVITGIALQRSAEVIAAGRNFEVTEIVAREPAGENAGRVSDAHDSIEFVSALEGRHQLDNMAIAILICRIIGVSPEICLEGVRSVYWPGRLEKIQHCGLDVIIDCGHNPAGIDTLCAYLRSRSLMNVHLIFGALACKDWKGMVDRLAQFASSWDIIQPPSARALASDQLKDYLSCNGIMANSRDPAHIGELISEFAANSSQKPVVLVGSIYLIGALRARLGWPIRPLWEIKRQ